MDLHGEADHQNTNTNDDANDNNQSSSVPSKPELAATTNTNNSKPKPEDDPDSLLDLPPTTKLLIEQILASDELHKPPPHTFEYVQSLPDALYLQETVLPLVTLGLTALAQERPPNPVEWLALFLMRNMHDEVCGWSFEVAAARSIAEPVAAPGAAVAAGGNAAADKKETDDKNVIKHLPRYRPRNGPMSAAAVAARAEQQQRNIEQQKNAAEKAHANRAHSDVDIGHHRHGSTATLHSIAGAATTGSQPQPNLLSTSTTPTTSAGAKRTAALT